MKEGRKKRRKGRRKERKKEIRQARNNKIIFCSSEIDSVLLSNSLWSHAKDLLKYVHVIG